MKQIFARIVLMLLATMSNSSRGEIPIKAIAADPAPGVFRKVVIGADRATSEDPLEITPQSAGIAGSGDWSIRKETLHGGRQEGVEILTVNNGSITIVLAATRGLSVLEARRGDFRLGWDSPVKEVVHPASIDLSARGGLGWLEGFNEFLVRCGLEYAGHPGRDKFVDNTGQEAAMDLSLHGRIGNLPASGVEVVIDRLPPHRISVRGSVHERQFYGPALELVVELSTIPGTTEFQIVDTVVNHGAHPQEFELIYHSNYGTPLLEGGARVYVPAASVTPMNARAAAGIEDYATFLPPTAGYSEQVYLIEPIANAKHETIALLQNAQGERGASIRWSIDELPLFTLWKNTAPEAAGYVTGLEPGTNFPFNRRIERQAGRLGKLKPGESRSFHLTYAMHSSSAEVDKVRQEVAAIQGSRETQLVPTPPEVD
jgi:hypothetical protein